jgi:hypothetical protein
MLLFPDKQLVIYTPPKTASTTLIEVLCRAPYNAILCVGPVGNEGHYDHHSTATPPLAHSWRKLATVRHPLQRLMSLWGHFAKNELLHGRGAPNPEQFAWDVVHQAHPFYFYGWNQSRVLGADNYELIRQESLGADLYEAGVLAAPTDLPRSNYFDANQSSPRWNTCLSRAVIEALRFWWEEDLRRFSYKIQPDELPPYPAVEPVLAPVPDPAPDLTPDLAPSSPPTE